jgi:TonB family protein
MLSTSAISTGPQGFTKEITMSQPNFSKNFKSTASRIFLLFTLLILALAVLGLSQDDGPLRVYYFVSPEFPPLARQAMMSGDVMLTVTVDASGKPTDIAAKAPYGLLGGPAKEIVERWRFNPVAPPSTRRGYVFIHYSFSGTTRDCNPRTIVAADLENLRVIVTVDPRLPFDGE